MVQHAGVHEEVILIDMMISRTMLILQTTWMTILANMRMKSTLRMIKIVLPMILAGDEKDNQVMSKYNIQNTLYQKTTTFNT